MDMRTDDAADAQRVLEAHLSQGAVVHVPSESGRKGKVVGLLTTLMAAGVMSTAIASTPVHDDLKAGDALSAPQATKNYVLEIDPNAPATPEALSQVYTTLEAATLAQFPEMRGKFAVYNPFNDPQAEEARIAAMLDATDPLKSIQERRGKGYTGGEAVSVATANGYACVAVGWAHNPKDPIDIGSHAHAAVHETMHCLDPEYFVRGPGSMAAYDAIQRNLETVAQVGARDWEIRNGASVADLQHSVAKRWRDVSATKDLKYAAADNFYTLQGIHKDHQGTGMTRLDFSNLGASLDTALKIRDAQREDAATITDRQDLSYSLGMALEHLDEKGDQAAMRAFLEENKDIPLFNKVRVGEAYLEAERTGAPLPDLSEAVGSDPLADQVYARWHLKALNGTASDADRVFAGGLDMWAYNAFAIRDLDGADEFIERVKTDRAYAEAVASGEVSVLAGVKPRQGEEPVRYHVAPLAERFATEQGGMPDLALKAAAFLRDSEGSLTREQRMEARAAGLVFKEIAASGGAPAAKVEKVMQTLETVQNLVPDEQGAGAPRLDQTALRNLATWAVKDAPAKTAPRVADDGAR